MKKVIIESPYAGDTVLNLAYAKACMKDSLLRDEAPIASHLIYTQVLNDHVPAERALGIEAGIAWGLDADLIAVYTDNGISDGMKDSIEKYKYADKTIEYRTLKNDRTTD